MPDYIKESERVIMEAKIDQWYICLIDENGAEERLNADLPDDITQRVDEMVEAEYDVTWGE